jgi:hypothetical protein
MNTQECKALQDVIMTMLRKRFWSPVVAQITQQDIDDLIDLLGRLDRSEKLDFWQ